MLPAKAQRVLGKLKHVGHQLYKGGVRVAGALDKAAGHAYDFLSHLDPQAVRGALGDRHTERLDAVARGLHRYEQVRHRVRGPRRHHHQTVVAEEVD